MFYNPKGTEGPMSRSYIKAKYSSIKRHFYQLKMLG